MLNFFPKQRAIFLAAFSNYLLPDIIADFFMLMQLAHGWPIQPAATSYVRSAGWSVPTTAAPSPTSIRRLKPRDLQERASTQLFDGIGKKHCRRYRKREIIRFIYKLDC